MSRGAIQKSLWHPIRINTTAASSIFVEFQCLCLVERARRVVGEVSEAERDQHSPLKIWSVVTIFPWKISSLFPTPSPSKSWFVIMGKLLFDLDLSSRLLLIRCFEEDQVGENCSQRWGFLWWFSMMIFNDAFQWLVSMMTMLMVMTVQMQMMVRWGRGFVSITPRLWGLLRRRIAFTPCIALHLRLSYPDDEHYDNDADDDEDDNFSFS